MAYFKKPTHTLYVKYVLSVCIVLILAVIAVVSPFNALFPDLVPLPPENLALQSTPDGKTVLVFDSTYYNQGAGPLELRSTGAAVGPRGEEAYAVSQRTYRSYGWHEDTPVSIFVWDEEHYHYHFDNFIALELETVSVAQASASSTVIKKTTFCLRDVDYTDIPHRTPAAYYITCNKNVQGVSPGWGDTYYADYPGQNIDVTSLPSGTYRLTHRVNPDKLLTESDYNNNTASVLFTINKAAGTVSVLEETSSTTPPIVQKPLEQPFGIGGMTAVVADNLDVPWDIAFLPEGEMLITERSGHLIAIAPSGTQRDVPIAGVRASGEGGLLGIALHPNFKINHLLYLYMTTPGAAGQTTNRVIRYRYQNSSLTEDKTIISGIPGAVYHDGGRLAFGPDGMLYVTTGDAGVSSNAQDTTSLAGKILRLTDDGGIPIDNPFGNAVYSYGHRNPQGLAWDSAGRLWETEHGRSGTLSGLDEINLIHPGVNYGWPVIEGTESAPDMETPAYNSGPNTTWAPASAAYLDGSLYFGGLRGEALYQAVLEGEQIVEFKVHLRGELGRIRTVTVGPDGMLYVTTSNRDGRGTSHIGDDKIFKVDPALLR